MVALAKTIDGSRPKAGRRAPVDPSQMQSLQAASEAAARLHTAIRTAVVSVSDKTNLEQLGLLFSEFGITAIATGGTYSSLRTTLETSDNAEAKAIEISDFTGYPENLNGRLKTLHPKVQAGILAIRGYHDAALQKFNAKYIDLVVANLYPFRETVAKGSPFFECIENIDIGGPAMIRAAAKNHACVTVIVDPADYSRLADEMRANNGATTLEFRQQLARKAFLMTSNYDEAISKWFEAEAK